MFKATLFQMDRARLLNLRMQAGKRSPCSTKELHPFMQGGSTTCFITSAMKNLMDFFPKHQYLPFLTSYMGAMHIYSSFAVQKVEELSTFFSLHYTTRYLVSATPGFCFSYLQVLDVLRAAELWQASSFHQCKQVQEERTMAPQNHVGLFTVTPESVEKGRWSK